MIEYNERPKVSVCVITYNHERYIEKCIEGILKQTNIYDLEIIIGDDASTDKTRELISEFAKAYPNIKTIFHESNIGGCENYKSIHRAASGEYVVHIDGDDYMYPNRIQAQIDFLIANQDCSAVVHQLEIVNQAGHKIGKKWPRIFSKQKYDLNDVLVMHPIFGHSSLTFRRSSLTNFLYKDIKSFIDFEIYLELSKDGMIGAINKSMGAYRFATGISTIKNLYQLAIEAIERSATEFASPKIIHKALARQYFLFAKKSFVDKDFELMKKLIAESLSHGVTGPAQLILFAFRSHSGFLYWLYRLSKKLYWN
jgi:glycosyltransferase involved in cell wall biosynthesis